MSSDVKRAEEAKRSVAQRLLPPPSPATGGGSGRVPPKLGRGVPRGIGSVATLGPGIDTGAALRLLTPAGGTARSGGDQATALSEMAHELSEAKVLVQQ